MTRPAPRRQLRHPSILLLSLLGVLLPAVARSQTADDDLRRLSVEELMRIDVTTAGRREQPIGSTTAAMSVITGDDIRRSGVTTIADALMLADGVHVARVNNGTWRISARGFNGTTPNKLLVMVDGRTVYSAFFAGVFWNTLDYVLEDIDRIEVIRGPGAVLWGANAVNGVVNIITRNSRDTPGTLASLAVGNEDLTIAQLRHGGRAGAATWRAYGKLGVRDAQKLASGLGSGDGIRRGQGGFRLDSAAGGGAWMLSGDAFHSHDDLPDRPAGEFVHLALQGRWSRELAAGSRLDLQSYYRREFRRVPNQLTHHIDTVDVDLQHRTRWGTRHDVVWGGGMRVNWDATQGSATVRFEPEDRTYGLQSLFVQEEIAVVPGRFFTVLGVKYEHNSFSGGELQPNVRARLMMARNQIVWGAISRAVRRPTRLDDDLVATSTGGLVLLRGTDEFEAEKLTATELGYRVQPAATWSLDATAFWHRYRDLRSQDAPLTGLVPLEVRNTLQGTSHGLELGFNVQPRIWWRTHVGYTWLDTDVERQSDSRDTTGGAAEANDPGHLFTLRSSLDFPHEVQVDAVLRSVGELADGQTPAYTELTLRAGWHVTPRVELSITGQDLLHGMHPETGPPTPARVELERSVRVGTTFRF